MNFLRKAVVVTVCSLLPIALLGFGILFSIYQVLGSPTHIKEALDTSGIYDSAMASVVEQATNKQQTTTSQTPAGEAAVKDAVENAIPSSYIKEQTDGVLDGIYAWLRSETPDLSFAIDLSPVKTNLVNNLTEQARERAQLLPPCGPADIATSSTDPFSASCLPPGVSPDQAAEETRQTILSSEIFKEASITPQSIQKNGEKPLSEQLAPVKDGYQGVKKTLYLVGLTAIVCITAAIFLSKPRQSGLKKVSFILLLVGLLGIAAAVVGGAITRALVKNIFQESNGDLAAKAVQATQFLIDDIRNWWIVLGTIAIVTAVCCLAGLVLWKKKHPISTDPAPLQKP